MQKITSSKLFAWIFSFVRSALILFLCAIAGRSLSHLIGNALPSSILGMLILTLGLAIGLIKQEWVELCANFLLRWLSLLFIPISVALIDKLSLIAQYGVSILISIVFSTIIVMGFAGRLWQWLEGER